MLCLDETCLVSKQNQVFAAYLAQASAVANIPPLDPDDDHWQKIDTTNERVLQIALAKKCSNLRLAFNRQPWQSGHSPDPENFDRCRYVCLHNNEGCACANQEEARVKEEEKKKKKALQKLNSTGRDHLAQIAQDSLDDFLRVILYSTTGYAYGGRDEKVLTLPPQKVISRLARWMLEKNAPLTPYRSLDENQQRIDEFLAEVNFPPLDGDKTPGLDRRLARIETWIAISNEKATPDAIRGNLTNLAKLAEEIYLVDDFITEEEDLQALLPRLDAAKQTLLAWQQEHEIQQELQKIKTRLEKDAPTATPKQYLNKGAALSDLVYDINKLIRDHGETADRRALLTEIEQLETGVIAATRAVRAQTHPPSSEKEVQTV